jgi:hypothetical protein
MNRFGRMVATASPAIRAILEIESEEFGGADGAAYASDSSVPGGGPNGSAWLGLYAGSFGASVLSLIRLSFCW